MKKAFVLCVIISMMCSMIAFADETELFFPTYEQTASAYLDQSGKAVKVTVDLTGGWSVEFAPGAVYLYEGNTDGEATALGITLDEEVFQDYTKEAKNSNSYSYREFAHCFSFTEENGYTDYFFSPGSGSFFMISVRPGEDSAIVRSRISIEPAEFLVPEPETETE